MSKTLHPRRRWERASGRPGTSTECRREAGGGEVYGARPARRLPPMTMKANFRSASTPSARDVRRLRVGAKREVRLVRSTHKTIDDVIEVIRIEWHHQRKKGKRKPA